jgi:hypothetical protein
VACLPRLRVLQLDICLHCVGWDGLEQGEAELREDLGSLQGATQLQELYLTASSQHPYSNAALAQLFPDSLKHLSWHADQVNDLTADFSHLTQLTALRLLSWCDSEGSLSSSSLPPGVQQLELDVEQLPGVVLVEQQAKLVLLPDLDQVYASNEWEWEALSEVSKYTNLGGLRLCVVDLFGRRWINLDDMVQLPRLSALTVVGEYLAGQYRSNDPVECAARSIPGLRWLTLALEPMVPPPDLSRLTALQRLTLQLNPAATCDQQQQAGWGQQLGGLTSLRWLSVPNALVGTLAPWLGRLQQLRVLVVVWRWPSPGWQDTSPADDDNSCVPWLEGFSTSMLPPQLQLLGVTGTLVQQPEQKQLRRRLQRALGDSGCEVVVDVDLDEVGGCLWRQARWPHALLAGWPSVLQQVLA